MGLGDSVGGDTVSEKSDKNPQCHSCNTAITTKSLLCTTVCNHSFHKDCLSRNLKLRPYCPVCNSRIVSEGPQRSTRANSKALTSGSDSASTSLEASNNNSVMDIPLQGNTTSDPAHQAHESLQNMVSSMIMTQHEQLVSTLSKELAKLVESTVQNSFSRYNIINPGFLPPSQLDQRTVNQCNQPSGTPQNGSQVLRSSSHEMQSAVAVEQRTFREAAGNYPSNGQPHPAQPNFAHNSSPFHAASVSELSIRPDRVSQIISNWKLKFNGGQNGLSVEHFIYRIEALTRQTLNGDFNLLCSNAGLLFEGKADGWFWRYHMSVPFITWSELCSALRKQYKDSRTDIDIRELIRDRKQKLNESFDSFYEAIVSLTDRLVEPLHTSSLVEILRRNLLPEIQHEILNLKVNTVEELRDICRRREFFLLDMRKKHGVQLSKSGSRRIAELIHNFVDADEVQSENTEEIGALELNCWNCHKPGHRYQDCLSERTVFCYGCGKPDTYKPNCPNCHTKNLRASALVSPKGVHRPVKQTEVIME